MGILVADEIKLDNGLALSGMVFSFLGSYSVMKMEDGKQASYRVNGFLHRYVNVENYNTKNELQSVTLVTLTLPSLDGVNLVTALYDYIKANNFAGKTVTDV